LAGSTLTMIEAVRNLVELGAATAAALSAASEIPARIAGRPELATLEAGTPADIVVLDDGLEIERVLVRGADALSDAAATGREEGGAAGPPAPAAPKVFRPDADCDAAAVVCPEVGRVERDVELADPDRRPGDVRLEQVHRRGADEARDEEVRRRFVEPLRRVD